MRFEDVKVGMLVRVNEDVRRDKFISVPEMEAMIGKTYRVSKIGKKGRYGEPVQLDGHCWDFSASSLDEVITHKAAPTKQCHNFCESCLYREFYFAKRKKELISLAEIKFYSPAVLYTDTDGIKKRVVLATVNGDYKVGVSCRRDGDSYDCKIGLALATFRAFGMKEEEREFLTII